MTDKITEHHYLRSGLAFLSAGTVYCALAKYKNISQCSWITQLGAFSVSTLAQSWISSLNPCERALCVDCRKTPQKANSVLEVVNLLSPVFLNGLAIRFCRFKHPLISTALVAAGYFGIYHALQSLESSITEITISKEEFQRLYGENNLPDIPITVNEDLDLSTFTEVIELPNNLTVLGNINVKACISLSALPNNLNVHGDLDLEGCTSLRALTADLNVTGSINLKGCTGLTTLPENFQVGENLHLDGCISLLSIPKNLSVNGDMFLRECPNLTTIYERLRVEGSLYMGNYEKHYRIKIDGCTNLSSISEWLSVGGELDLNGCAALRELPEGLHVGGKINLKNCTSLIKLPEDIQVMGDINLDRCSGLRSFPENLQCKGSLTLRYCTGLRILPDGMKPHYLSLYGCTGLRALPKGLNVTTILGLGGCSNLTSLPKDLKFGERLVLEKLPGITEIPKEIETLGDLIITNCPNFISLPEKLVVGGCLKIKNCPKLTTLPKGLRIEKDFILSSEQEEGGTLNIKKLPDDLFVGGKLDSSYYGGLESLGRRTKINGTLDIRGCWFLESLPEDLEVGGDLLLNNSGLKVRPSWITKLGHKNCHHFPERFINLDNTYLSVKDINFIKQNRSYGSRNGVRFNFGTQQIDLSSLLNGLFRNSMSQQTQQDLKVLGLEAMENPKQKNVKKAYKALAMKHHPDKNNGAGEEMFKTIQEAYERLMKTLNE